MKLQKTTKYLSLKANEASKLTKLKANRGLSLVELLVSVSIVIVITTVILAKHSEFSGTILLKNLAYDVALSIRKAQVFGLSLREFTASGATSEFDIGYGIHFNGSEKNSYTLFADRNKNNKYDGISENVEKFNIDTKYFISQVCGTLSDGTQKCTPSDISELDIIFERPNPDAIITSAGITYSTAKITVESLKGSTRYIKVEATGQIAVEQ